MDAMTALKTNGNTSKHIEDRFTAAVNVIRGLPKNGKIDIVCKIICRDNRNRIFIQIQHLLLRENSSNVLNKVIIKIVCIFLYL